MPELCLKLSIGEKNPNLELGDIDNFRKRYPQTSKYDNKPKWALACGSAVKYLLKADEVIGREIKNPDIIDEREHKDLEVYLFGNENLKGKSTNPLEIFGVNYFEPLRNIDYTKEEDPDYGLIIEAMKGYHFGFQLPTEDNCVELRIGHKNIHSLSPEYIIASKIFHTRGIRKGIDDTDSLKLMQKFHLDEDYLLELAKKSRFKFINKTDINSLEHLLMSGEYTNAIKDRIVQTYSSSGLPLNVMHYDTLTTMLDYTPQSFKSDVEKKHMDWIKKEVQSGSLDNDMKMRYLLRSFSPEFLGRCLNLHNVGLKEAEPQRMIDLTSKVLKNVKLGTTSEISQLLTKLKYIGEKAGMSYKEVGKTGLSAAENIVYSHFKNVRLALYDSELEKIAGSKNPGKEFPVFAEQVQDYSKRWCKGE